MKMTFPVCWRGAGHSETDHVHLRFWEGVCVAVCVRNVSLVREKVMGPRGRKGFRGPMGPVGARG